MLAGLDETNRTGERRQCARSGAPAQKSLVQPAATGTASEGSTYEEVIVSIIRHDGRLVRYGREGVGGVVDDGNVQR